MTAIAPDAALRALEAALRQSLRDIVREEVRAALVEPGGRMVRNSGESYLSIAKAAQVADVAPGTLRRWIRAGRLPVRRAGRVYRIGRAELESFLAREGRSEETSAKAREILRAA